MRGEGVQEGEEREGVGWMERDREEGKLNLVPCSWLVGFYIRCCHLLICES